MEQKAKKEITRDAEPEILDCNGCEFYDNCSLKSGGTPPLPIKCANCGETAPTKDALSLFDLHKIGGDIRDFKRERTQKFIEGIAKQIKSGEAPSNYILLCKNCHSYVHETGFHRSHNVFFHCGNFDNEHPYFRPISIVCRDCYEERQNFRKKHGKEPPMPSGGSLSLRCFRPISD